MTRKLDALLALAGVLFGAASLAWPFGWDTSVHYYVGREWLLRGAIPYRDTFDHKTPGIHLVHALAIAVFGQGMVGIRVVELCAMVVLGWTSASLARDDTQKPVPGLAGATVLAASVFYYGFYDYWNTAQCELLATTVAASMVLVATRMQHPTRAAAVVGLLAGVDFALKPPFVLFALLAIVIVGVRVRPARLARPLLAWVAGMAVVPSVVLLYFASHGALGDLVDLVGSANAVYFEKEPRLTTAAGIANETASVWRVYSPLAGCLFAASGVAVACALVRRSRARLGRWVVAAGMLIVGYAVIVVQLKFYYYHWIAELAAGTLMAANVMVDASNALRASRRAWAPAVASAVVLTTFALTGSQMNSWRRSTGATVHWLRGDWSRQRFASVFQTWAGERRYVDVEDTGTWIREHSAPGDELLVRGVAAEIYVVSGLHAPGRFFWTAFLTRPSRQFHREAWLAEDAAVIATRPPRWVVTWTDTADGPESTGYFLSRGYVERTRIGPYTVLERGLAPAK